jgi:hypothetical protein
MTPTELIAIYPSLDFLMAETILKCYENGTLKSFFDGDDSEPNTETTVLKSIVVEQPI